MLLVRTLRYPSQLLLELMRFNGVILIHKYFDPFMHHHWYIISATTFF
jgi:hypothetical protein